MYWKEFMSTQKLLVRWSIFISIVMVAFSLSAQEKDLMPCPPEKFVFSYDYSIFRTQQNKSLVELYYSIYRNFLKFVAEDSLYRATFLFKAEIWQGDSLISANQWKNVNVADSLSQIDNRQKLFGIGYFSIAPGEYLLKVELTDLSAANKKQYEDKLVVPTFPSDKLAMSDIQVASEIKKTDDPQNRFYKNGYVVIPNIDRFFGTGLPILMIYAEIYNLKKPGEPDTAKYAVNFQILDGQETVVRNFPAKIKVKPGNSAVEISGLNIISFHSGTYFLNVEVNDLFTNESVSKRTKFFIFREGDLTMTDSAAQKLQTQRIINAYEKVYSALSAEEIEDEFGAASYIATKEEKNIFKKLDEAGKRSFLIEFWQKRDEKPETPQNEFRDNYIRLMNTANEQFGGFDKGWKSDMGRVLLLYGVPDEIERFPYSSENKPYHIWKYFSIQGGVNFYFVDKRNFGKFELVHSTARGELYDPEWERWINPN